MAKKLQTWLDDYAESHQNPVNKAIHWVCVPVITVTTIAIFWSLTAPLLPQSLAFLNAGTVFLLLALGFYWQLSKVYFLVMSLVAGLCIIAIATAYGHWGSHILFRVSLLAFGIAWVGQFIGHKIEGKKPSFFKDLQFLFVGPLWLTSFIIGHFRSKP